MKKHLLLFFSLSFAIIIFAKDTHQYMFNHIRMEDGLASSQVNYIYKDAQGFMWFATSAGLTRYDGYEYKNYSHNSYNQYSLRDNYVKHLQEDVFSNIWIQLGDESYIVYEASKEVFYSDVSLWIEKNLGFGQVILDLVFIDKNKKYWFYTESNNLLVYYDPIKLAMMRYHLPVNYNDDVASIKEIYSHLVILLKSGELLFLNKTTLSVEKSDKFLVKNERDLKNIELKLFIDSENEIWIYSESGLGVWYYTQKKGSWIHLDVLEGENNSLSSNLIRSVTEDNEGLIWNMKGLICTDGGVLKLLIEAHQTYSTLAEGAAAIVKAGVGQFLDTYQPYIYAALENGLIVEEDIIKQFGGIFI